jgi:outer membrane biosynthesis protein TonB
MAALPSFPHVLAVLAVAVAVSACGNGRDASTTGAAAAAASTPASEQARLASGLSHLPRPANLEAFNRSLARHYPGELIGVRPSSSVLVDVTVNKNGFVENVAVVDRPAVTTTRAVLIDRAPGGNAEVTREAAAVYDTRFGPAAIAAVKEARFHPARRDGQPVPFTIRMSVEFTSPAS